MSKNLIERFMTVVDLSKERIAITEYQKENNEIRSINYEELNKLSDYLARIFLNLGIRPADVVSFQLPNSIEFVAVHIACLKIGAVSNPLMPIFRARELDYMIRHIGSRIVLYKDGFRGFSYSEMYTNLNKSNSTFQAYDIFGLLSEYRHKDLPPIEQYVPCEDDVVEMMFTSGTTGNPKAVMHSSKTIIAAVRPYIERLQLSDTDILYMGAPLAHATGFLYGVWASIFLSTKFVVQDIWDAELAWHAINTEGVTFTMGATPFLSDLMISRPSGESSLRTFVCGGAPVPRALVEAARTELKINIIAVWGMTECGVVTATFMDDLENKISGTDGAPFENFAIKVTDTNGSVLKPGVEGKLFVKSPSLLLGYYGRELGEILEDGWFDTGDLATIDVDGYVRITGRTKDIIIRGGENIPVVEIENILYKLEGITDLAVVGKSHARLGETGVCFATVKPGYNINLELIKTYLSEAGVAKSYWPEQFISIEDMPRTPSGKIQKFELRRLLKEGIVK